MFDKSNKKTTADLFGKINRIVEGTIMEGNITSQADFRIDGDLIGNFKSTGKVVIGSTGKVIGDIICVNADIEGKFVGKIDVSDILNVKSTAQIQGDVLIGKLSVEPGAQLNVTSCRMKDNLKLNQIESEKSGEKTA